MSVCVFVYIYIYIYICACAYVHVYVCVYVCVSVCLSVCLSVLAVYNKAQALRRKRGLQELVFCLAWRKEIIRLMFLFWFTERLEQRLVSSRY